MQETFRFVERARAQAARERLLVEHWMAANSRYLLAYAATVSRAEELLARHARPALDLAARWTEYASNTAALRLQETARLAHQSLRWAQAVAEGTFLGDFATITTRDASEKDVLAAIKRMAERWFTRPLHPQRYRLVKVELSARARANGTSKRVELEAAVKHNLFLALNDVSDETFTTDLLRVSRAKLANLLMEELVGPGWRQRDQGSLTSLDEFDPPSHLNVEYECEVQALYEHFWRAIEALPESQRKAVLARIEGRPLENAEHQALHRARTSTALREIAALAS
jgi:hypothetical protein